MFLFCLVVYGFTLYFYLPMFNMFSLCVESTCQIISFLKTSFINTLLSIEGYESTEACLVFLLNFDAA